MSNLEWSFSFFGVFEVDWGGNDGDGDGDDLVYLQRETVNIFMINFYSCSNIPSPATSKESITLNLTTIFHPLGSSCLHILSTPFPCEFLAYLNLTLYFP
ncbi:hypothetical protein OCU04_006481 [Sclerotinia nivalis]|uniref:Uncharacterized protein n=1 Tax=Sclerotinia nivalis TaxID=352851 RepID=A0A9X0ARI8_9HELO|nr:hypothetical protein OCU04_006481 [Sclerotinia nivalis]